MADEHPDHGAMTAEHREAMAIAQDTPARHLPRHVTSRQVHRRIHGDNPIGGFNNALAVFVTQHVGTMWAAYVFVLISLVSFPQALNAFMAGDTVTGISWLSQSFLQLVLLPVIMVGQRVISDAQDLRAEADHETLTALHKINVQQLRILELLERLAQHQSSEQKN